MLSGLAIFLSRIPAWAQAPQLPQPPCGGPAFPDYPRLGDPPNVKLWTSSELGPSWAPPACTAWPAGAATIVVGLAGHFSHAGGADSLLARIGAISALAHVRYWSVTEAKWNNMFERATALGGPDPKTMRGDFSAPELRDGGERYFIAADNRSGKDAVSRLHVAAAGNDHFVLETENVSPLRWSFLTYAAPGKFQTWYFLDRDGETGWRFYSLTRVLYASSLFGNVIPGKSYINRAVAMYRHLIGAQTDRDPPAAP